MYTENELLAYYVNWNGLSVLCSRFAAVKTSARKYLRLARNAIGGRMNKAALSVNLKGCFFKTDPSPLPLCYLTNRKLQFEAFEKEEAIHANREWMSFSDDGHSCAGAPKLKNSRSNWSQFRALCITLQFHPLSTHLIQILSQDKDVSPKCILFYNFGNILFCIFCFENVLEGYCVLSKVMLRLWSYLPAFWAILVAPVWGSSWGNYTVRVWHDSLSPPLLSISFTISLTLFPWESHDISHL